MRNDTCSALWLAAAALALSGCASVKPRLLCSEEAVDQPLMVALGLVKSDDQTVVQATPESCTAVGGVYLRFQPSSAFDKAASITFVTTGDKGACDEPQKGDSPLDGSAHPVGRFDNGFAQPIETRIAKAAASKKYYYCVSAGVGPMPYPAIIIKPD